MGCRGNQRGLQDYGKHMNISSTVLSSDSQETKYTPQIRQAAYYSFTLPFIHSFIICVFFWIFSHVEINLLLKKDEEARDGLKWFEIV